VAKQLLFSITPEDCEFETFRSGGKGGGNQNSRSTGVRWTHRPSGAVGEARDSRHQHQNKLSAWRRMATSPKMVAYIRAKVRQEKDLLSHVNDLMDEKNLKVEGFDGQKWILLDKT
jgi:protein subunit release factor B